jgi:hypothetical protein
MAGGCIGPFQTRRSTAGARAVAESDAHATRHPRQHTSLAVGRVTRHRHSRSRCIGGGTSETSGCLIGERSPTSPRNLPRNTSKSK